MEKRGKRVIKSAVVLGAVAVMGLTSVVGATGLDGVQEKKAPKIEVRVSLKGEQESVEEYKDMPAIEENRQAYIMASLGVMGNVTDGNYGPDRVIKASELEIVKSRLEKYGIWVSNIEEQTRREVANTIVGLMEEWGIELGEVEIKSREEIVEQPVRGGYTREIPGVFNASAYDLSFQSCGKSMSHPLYGITASGYSLRGMSRTEAMTIAADTRVLPMGSQVYVDFTEPGYEDYSGVYTVRDRGGAIKGRKIDIFMGDFQQHAPSREAINFGRLDVKVYTK